MRKKNNPPVSEHGIIDEQILMTAKLSVNAERRRVASHCVICGAEAAPTSSENLCWVCRRLKISAWRESDQQMSTQD